MTKSDDEAKRKILARRAAFVAAALAGVGAACKEPDVPPQPCLSTVPIEPLQPPEPCLSPVPPPPPEELDAGASDAQPPPPEVIHPRPCLTIRLVEPDAGKPVPRPCLKIAPPSSQRPDAGAAHLVEKPCLEVIAPARLPDGGRADAHPYSKPTPCLITDVDPATLAVSDEEP